MAVVDTFVVPTPQLAPLTRAATHPMSSAVPAAARFQVLVLRSFELRADNQVVAVPQNVQRVLAFLAVRGRPQLRTTVASTLWMDTTEDRASANLRTALWKVRQQLGDLVRASGAQLEIAAGVDIDLASAVAQAKRLIGPGTTLDERDTDPELLGGDLLPEWDEDWILFERERIRQLRIHALEALCRRLSAEGRHGEAIDAGQAAVAAEPLRESSHGALISAHLAEGNVCEARRQYRVCCELFSEDLQLEPSAELRSLVFVDD
jgi:DNA-binding SARP family transcriptional activator